MNKKQILIIGIFTYGVLLILSILFYKERTAFADISYHLFAILKDGTFAIQNNRFGAAITQLVPLVGSKLGLSLKAIAISYSIAFALLYLLIFIIICEYLKNTKIALAFLFLVY